jgi:hypothetical protein
MAARARGESTPFEPKSSCEKEEGEGEVIPPPLSPPCETLPLFGDIISRQQRVTVSMRQSKRTQQRSGHRSTCPNNLISC